MRKEQFIQYLDNPLLMGEASIAELKSVVDSYPFFQTAHLLYAKALSNVNHVDYYTGLKKTSILAGDRKVLYELITRNQKITQSPAEEKKTEFTEEKITQEIKPEIKETKITAEEIQLPEIKLVSNTTSPSKISEIKIDYTGKHEGHEEEIIQKKELPKQENKEPVQEHIEKVTRVELVVTPREKEEEKTILSKITEEEKVIAPVEKPKEEIHIPKEKNVDDVVLDRVVNAYIEKEILGVDEIDKPLKKEILPQIDPEEGKQILTQTLNEPHSFSEWLKLLNSEKQAVSPSVKKEEKPFITSTEKEITEKPVAEAEEKSTENQPLSQKEKIIEKIISTEPKISRPRETKEFFKPQEKSKESIVKDEMLVTETLAWILEKQGKYPEAIKAYHVLSLKYPEKSVKFASLISEIRKKQKQK